MSDTGLDHLAALGRAQDVFAEALAAADPEAPVAGCPPWRVADLALHLGAVHWWAAAMARGVDLDPTEPTAPRDAPTLAAFYRWAARALLETLAGRPPDAPALTLLGPGPASFWHRRQLHETLVHLVDLCEAVGDDLAAAAGAGEEVWADTVDELVTVMAPRQVRLGRTAPPDDAVDLVAGARTWRLGPAQGPAVVTLSGPARELALRLWRRTGPPAPALRVDGDAAALDRVLALRLTP